MEALKPGLVYMPKLEAPAAAVRLVRAPKHEKHLRRYEYIKVLECDVARSVERLTPINRAKARKE